MTKITNKALTSFVLFLLSSILPIQAPAGLLAETTISNQRPFDILTGLFSRTLSQKDNEELISFAEDYRKNIGYLSSASLDHIPHAIHFVWLGNRPFPQKSIPNVISWIEHHPGWDVFFWTDSAEASVPVPGMKKRLVCDYDFGVLTPYISRSTEFCERADMMRYMILFQEGGVYADHDVWCEQSVDTLLSHFDFVAGLDPSQVHPGIESNIIPNNSTIISRPGHPILSNTIGNIALNWDSATQEYLETGHKNRIELVARRTLAPFVTAVKTHRNIETRDIVLPDIYFYSHGVFPQEVFEKLHTEGYVYVIHKHNL